MNAPGPDELPPGAELGGYRIEAVAGRGGMGIVYRARQLRLERVVALKVLSPALAGDERFRARFEGESRIATSIEHPHVVPVYDVTEADGALLIAMRFVEGTDLAATIDREGPLAPERAAALVEQVADALDAAHARGLVHRDVKPANVLLSGSAGREHAYLTDFGLSKLAGADSGMTAATEFVGTVDYAAPEQLRGEAVDARTDVYSLGCVLYECLTGEVPFPRESQVARLEAHLNDPPPAPSERAPYVPAELDEVVARALAKRSRERYPSAGDLAKAALAAAAGKGPPKSGGLTVPSRGHTAPAGSAGGRRRRVVLLVAAAVALAAGVGAAIVLLAAGGGKSDEQQVKDVARRYELGNDPRNCRKLVTPLYISDYYGQSGRKGLALCEADLRATDAKNPPPMSFRDVAINGNEATAKVDLSGQELSLGLVRRDGRWRLDSFSETPASRYQRVVSSEVLLPYDIEFDRQSRQLDRAAPRNQRVPPGAYAAYGRSLERSLAAGLARLDELHPPDELRDLHARVVRALRGEVTALHSLVRASRAGDRRAVRGALDRLNQLDGELVDAYNEVARATS